MKESCDVVYLVLSHSHPDQVVRLVNRLLAGNDRARVVVHHDYARSHLDPARLDPGAEVLHHTQGIGWGSFELLLATLRSLEWVEENLDYSWLVFISGQDYPLRPPQELQEFLLESECDAFLERPVRVEQRFRDETGGRDFWSARYFYRYRLVPGTRRRLPRLIRSTLVHIGRAQSLVYFWRMPDNAGTLFGTRRLRHPFTEGFQCYSGSQWFNWSRKCVRAVLEVAQTRPELLAYYRRTVIPDESFFNTVVMNRDDLAIRFDSLRYFRMAPPWYSHPETLRLDDLETLIASGRYFARKFDAGVDGRILDALDRQMQSLAR